MIWLTWRQFRVQFLVVASVIVALPRSSSPSPDRGSPTTTGG